MEELYEMAWKLRVLHRHTSIALHDHVSAPDLPKSRAFLLRAVLGMGRCTQKEIAEHLGVSSPTVAVAVKSLEKDGYLQKTQDRSDLRYNAIELTDKGREATLRAIHSMEAFDRKLLDGFSREELKQMGLYMDRILENLHVDPGELKKLCGMKNNHHCEGGGCHG